VNHGTDHHPLEGALSSVGDGWTGYPSSGSVDHATFYMWKKQYAGPGVQDLRELRSLREENRGLWRIVAVPTLDRQILQEVVSRKL